MAKSLGGWVVLAVDRGEQARFGTRELAVYTREAMASALMYSTAPLGWGWAPPDVDPTVTGGAVPVLFVPGYTRNRSTFVFLKTFLRQRGFGALYAVNHPAGDRSLLECAAALAEDVQVLKRATGAAQVDIVAASLGGLMAAWYLRHLGGQQHVRRLVTLGCPFRGTRVAVFSRGRIASEILFESPSLDGLCPPPVPTVSIWSPDDPIVVPSASALPEGVESVRIDGTGHVEMLTSTRVFRAVHAALTSPLADRRSS